MTFVHINELDWHKLIEIDKDHEIYTFTMAGAIIIITSSWGKTRSQEALFSCFKPGPNTQQPTVPKNEKHKKHYKLKAKVTMKYFVKVSYLKAVSDFWNSSWTAFFKAQKLAKGALRSQKWHFQCQHEKSEFSILTGCASEKHLWLEREKPFYLILRSSPLGTTWSETEFRQVWQGTEA